MSSQMIEEEKMIGKLCAQIAELMNRIRRLEFELEQEKAKNINIKNQMETK